jgi:hypothetical protein
MNINLSVEDVFGLSTEQLLSLEAQLASHFRDTWKACQLVRWAIRQRNGEPRPVQLPLRFEFESQS